MLSFPFQLCLFFILVVFSAPSFAQTSGLFRWEFVDNDLSTSLPTCASLPITVHSYNSTFNTSQGTPPYYMIAFVVGGTPTSTLIGVNESSLSWTITEPANSQLVLSVVDANGSAGGVQPRIFTVIPSQNTQCITSSVQTPAFTVQANATGDLPVNQPWGLSVTGGVPPYTATIVQLASSNVTNITALDEGSFAYINNANGCGQIIGAFSDATGRWASGTPLITQDSSNAACINSGGTATSAPPVNSTPPTNSHPSVAVVLSVVLLFVVTGIGGIWYFLQQRRKQAEQAHTIPEQYVEIESRLPSVHAVDAEDTGSWSFPPRGGASSRATPMPPLGVGQNAVSNHSRNPASLASTNALSYTSGPGTSDAVPPVPPDKSEPARSRPSSSGRSTILQGFRFPARHSVKRLEANNSSATSPDSEYPLESAISDNSNVLGQYHSVVLGTRGGYHRGVAADVPIEEEYQHEDGGPIGELPPPGPPPPYVVVQGVVGRTV